MFAEIAAADKFGKRRLRELVGVQVGGLLHQAQAFDDVFGTDAPADAQAGKGDFREAINLDDVAGAVERFQRRVAAPRRRTRA